MSTRRRLAVAAVSAGAAALTELGGGRAHICPFVYQKAVPTPPCY